MALIYALIIIIASLGISKLVIKKESKFYKLRIILGFCFLLAILQIGYYPIQFFKLSSKVFIYYTSFVLIPSFLIGLIHLKKEDFDFLNNPFFYFLLIMVFFVIKIVPSIDAGDDWFYMALFKDNSMIEKINTIDPRTGQVGKIDSVYLFQGFFLLQSYFYNIQNSLFNSATDILVVSRSLFSLLFVLFSSIILDYIKSLNLLKNHKFVFFLIQLLSILLISYIEWEHIYWGSYSIFMIFIPLYILIFNEYVKSYSTKIKKLLFVLTISLISICSSSLFLIIFITFSFFLYSLYNKKANVEDYFFILIPTIFNGILLLNWLILIPITFVLYVIVHKYNYNISRIFNKYMFKFVFILPIIMTIYGCVSENKIDWVSYKLGYPLLIFNFSMSFFILFFLRKKFKSNPILFVYLMYILFFFNPFVCNFISNYLTSKFVYYRLYYAIKNPYLITILFAEVYKFIENKTKILRYIFVICIILLITYYGHIALDNTVFYKDYSNIEYNYFLRESTDLIELGQKLYELKDGKVLSIYVAPRIYNSELESTVYKYPGDKNNETHLMYQVIYMHDDIDNKSIKEFNKRIADNNYTHIIIFNDEKVIKRLSHFKIAYQNKSYVLLET